MKINIFWFRRDLRLFDNVGLSEALSSGLPVLPIFIYDTEILEDLPSDDHRVSFIYKINKELNKKLAEHNSGLLVLHGKPIEVFKELIAKYNVDTVYYNRDYEPYAINRDIAIEKLLEGNSVKAKDFKDQVIFERKEIVKNDGTPYIVFTPYKNRWLERYENTNHLELKDVDFKRFYQQRFSYPDISSLGFKESALTPRSINYEVIEDYGKFRDYPSMRYSSNLGLHLRFGTVSIRELVSLARLKSSVFLSELIWREFFMQVLYNFPYVSDTCFRKKYENLPWRNNEKEFEAWCRGETGYPIVDAGMHELNSTGYMHNRVRMIAASFLVKHLLIDWRWGEAYFAEKLFDYELSSNNGNWQWVAGTGCDAAPYFRIFNPIEQQKKYDKSFEYIKEFLPGFNENRGTNKIVDHVYARKRAIEVYKKV